MMLLSVILMFACASCEDTLVKESDIPHGLSKQEAAMGFQKRKNGEGIEVGEYGNTLNSEMMNKMEEMEKTIISLEKRISMMNRNNSGFIYNEPDIDQMLEDIKENKKDIGLLRNNIDINEEATNVKISQLTDQHSTDVENLESELDTKTGDISTFLASSLPPIGSIIAWIGPSKSGSELPAGWQRCDGSVIRTGVLHGQHTPDLNNDHRFLRGGLDSEVYAEEDDTVQDHHHVDNGHKHTDSGHSHSDSGHSHSDNGHSHRKDDKPLDNTYYNAAIHVLCDNHHDYRFDNDGGHCMRHSWYTANGYASIASSKANIGSSTASISSEYSGLGGVIEESTETRPKNMKIVYIMRIE